MAICQQNSHRYKNEYDFLRKWKSVFLVEKSDFQIRVDIWCSRFNFKWFENIDTCKSESVSSHQRQTFRKSWGTLTAKAFCVWCDTLPVNLEMERKEKWIREEFKLKLVTKTFCYHRSFISEKWMDCSNQRHTKLAFSFPCRYY